MHSKALISLVMLFCLVVSAVPFFPQAVADAPRPLAGAKLYVGPSSTYSTIQAAVNAAGIGDMVIVANGTYKETVTVNKANLLLRGNSTKDCKVHYATNASDPLNTYAAVFNVTAADVNITGFKIQANGKATHAVANKYAAHNLTLYNNNITVLGKGAGLSDFTAGVMMVAVNDVTIKNNVIRVVNIWSDGIYLQGCDRAALRSNTVKYETSYGFAMVLVQSRNCTLDKNTVSMNNTTPRGIWLFSNCMDNTVSNNTITDKGPYTLCLLIDSSHRNTVKHNTITSTAYFGVGIWMPYSASRNKVLNNTITMSNSSAIGMKLEQGTHDNTISGNTVVAGGTLVTGIYLFSNARSNNISKNTVRISGNTATGVSMVSSSDNTLWGNDINSTSNGGSCIDMSKSERTRIAGGNVVTCTQDNTHGIWVLLNSNLTAISDAKIRTYGPHGSGIFMDGYSNGITIKRCDVVVTGQYANALKATHGNMVAYDSKFDATQNKDIAGENDAVMTAINCTFSDVELFNAAGATLYVKNYLWVYVAYEGGMVPLPGADVTIINDGVPEYASAGYSGTDPLTDADGYTGKLLVQDRWYDHSNTALENDTAIGVKKTVDRSWEENRTGIDMSTSHCEAFAAADIEAPLVPPGLTIERVGSANRLNVSWQTVFDALNYEVYTNASGTWTFMDNVTHPLNWTVTATLPDEQRYDFKVRAWDNAPGFVSAFSPVASYYLTDITPPAMPLGLAAAPIPGDDGINITWTPNADDTKNYELWWKEQTATAWTKLGNITHPNATFALYDASIVNGTTYEFRLRSFDKVGLFSPFNTNASVVSYDQLPPGPADNLTATTLSESSIRLDWHGTDPDMAGFVVYINDSEIGHTDRMVGYDISTGFDYTFENLTQNTTYSFVVRAYDEALNLGPESNKASNTTLKHLDAPRVLQTFPANGTKGVGVDESVAIVFNIPMGTGSVADKLSVLPLVDFVLNWSVGNTILEISFRTSLRYNTSYTVTIGNVASAEGVFMAEYPYVFSFTTEAEAATVAKTLAILSPAEGAKYQVMQNITVSGTSSGLMAGTEVTVTLSGLTQKCTTDASGAWTAVIKAPSVPGGATILVNALVCSDMVNITVEAAPVDDDVDDDIVDDDDDDTGNNYALYAVIGIVAFLILVIIIVAIVVIMRKRKGAEPTPASAAEPTQPEQAPEPPAAVSSPGAIEPEVESKDIFREKDKAEAKREVQKEAVKAEPLSTPAQDIAPPAASAASDLGSWPVPKGGDIVPISDTHPAEAPSKDIIEDPFRSDLPKAGQTILALPPAQVFESEFEDMPKIDELFLISKTGLLLRHFTYKDTTVVDKDILASMLTVIQNFITDSFGKSDTSLKTMGFGKFNILIVPGTTLSVVVISSEEDLKALENPVKSLIQTIEEKNKQLLKDWSGDAASLIGIDEAVGGMLGK